MPCGLVAMTHLRAAELGMNCVLLGGIFGRSAVCVCVYVYVCTHGLGEEDGQISHDYRIRCSLPRRRVIHKPHIGDVHTNSTLWTPPPLGLCDCSAVESLANRVPNLRRLDEKTSHRWILSRLC